MISRNASPSFSCRSRRRFRICAWIETSSADVGSSQTMKSGFEASARAIAIRWRCPPENSCGYLRASAGSSPTRRRSSAVLSVIPCGLDARAPAPLPALHQSERENRLVDDRADAPARIERGVGVLKDHLHAPPHLATRGAIAGREEIDALDQHLPGAWPQKPDHHPRKRRLAGARFAHNSERFAATTAKSTPSTAFRRRRGSRSMRRESQGCETSKTRLRSRASTSRAAFIGDSPRSPQPAPPPRRKASRPRPDRRPR